MSFNNKAKKEILHYLIATKEKIKVKPGKCRFNYKCHMNTVHDAIEKKHDRIAMCMYADDGYPIIHFINITKGGKFVDNTLGHWCSQHDYYLIKYIEKEDFFNITDIFKKFRIEIKKELSFTTMLFSNIEF